MFEIITGESSKGYKKKNMIQNDQKQWINMHSMKGFHYGHQLQVYLYACIYVYPEKMEEEKYSPATKIFVAKYNKISTPDQSQNIGLDLAAYV